MPTPKNKQNLDSDEADIKPKSDGKHAGGRPKKLFIKKNNKKYWINYIK